MKIMKTKYGSTFNREVLLNQQLNHPNIVKYIEHYENIQFKDLKGAVNTVNCIIFEYAENGDLFDFIEKKKFS